MDMQSLYIVKLEKSDEQLNSGDVVRNYIVVDSLLPQNRIDQSQSWKMHGNDRERPHVE
jgi:hypothetical protein